MTCQIDKILQHDTERIAPERLWLAVLRHQVSLQQYVANQYVPEHETHQLHGTLAMAITWSSSSYLHSHSPLGAPWYRIRCHTAAYQKVTVLHPGIITACPDGHQSGIWSKLLCITMTALSTQAVGRPVLEEAFRTSDHCSTLQKELVATFHALQHAKYRKP